jgi:branched-chain amino acid transport system ATP-binding protein
MTARHLRSRQSLADAVIGTPRHHREERRTHERARELLAIFGLDGLADEIATNLPYGSQRRLEIARALATEPALLLLDEPAAGMNPQESLELMDLIRWIRDEFSLTILLVEHNMKVVMGICEQIQVIDYGEAIAFGTPAEIQRNPAVIAAYLGGGH